MQWRILMIRKLGNKPSFFIDQKYLLLYIDVTVWTGRITEWIPSLRQLPDISIWEADQLFCAIMERNSHLRRWISWFRTWRTRAMPLCRCQSWFTGIIITWIMREDRLRIREESLFRTNFQSISVKTCVLKFENW